MGPLRASDQKAREPKIRPAPGLFPKEKGGPKAARFGISRTPLNRRRSASGGKPAGISSDLSTHARREETKKMEDFEADLDTLRVKRAALEEQRKKGRPDARSLQDQLRNLDAQIAILEQAIANEDVSRDA
jgi:hypothetical protein